jgi:taurine dioxygenase
MKLMPEAQSKETKAIETVPTGAGVGAEVKGVDLRAADGATFEQTKQARIDRSVLLLRDQTLGDHDILAFSRHLGDLDWAPIQETGRRYAEGMLSNVVNGQPIGSLGTPKCHISSCSPCR